MSMNPRETTDKIKQDYQNYIASILRVRDQEITALAHRNVKNTAFVKGPFLEITLPFKGGCSLKELADEGLVSKEFAKMGKSVHYEDWKLRVHQEEALRHIIQKERNMVVSTGTGSGKTECYLYPVFNALMREKEAGTLDDGVRALLIFPMNALANDQQKKLRKLLKDYPDITFGRYTGETEHARKKETAEQAEKRLHEEYDLAHALDIDDSLRKSIPNELMCRERMVEKPPHILLTNYAMLEYMLLRPDTAPFFDNGMAKNWQFIIIDEAHTYKGANGTEIAFLLRRVKERIRHNMNKPFRCIATSATLGSEGPEAKAAMAAFAENLFGEPFTEEDIITTKRKDREKLQDGRNFLPEDYISLKESVKDKTEEEKGKILYDALIKDFRLFRVYEELKGKPKQIENVASVVFDDIIEERDRETALIDLIELAAAAKRSEFDAALLPARYHLFIKSLEGMFVQYYPRKEVYLDRKEYIKEGNNTYAVFELSNCQKCGQEYLVGKKSDGIGGEYFTQTSSSERPDFYFVSSGDSDDFSGFDEDDSIEENEKIRELEKYHLCLCCGRITPYAKKAPLDCCPNPDAKKIVTVYNLNYSGKDGESNCCPCCGATRKGLIRRFLTANQPATFAVAKSLYEAIPARPVKAKPSDDIFDDDLFEDNIFDGPFDEEESKGKTEITDESGRKLLIFSDNRQEAAFFAGFFEKKYSLLMWRKVILQVLKEEPDHTLCVGDLVGRVMNAADKAGIYSFDQERKSEMTDNQKKEMAAHYIMQEFVSPDMLTGLERLGYIEIFPEAQSINESKEIAGLKGKDLWNLLRYMMDTLRQKGAVTYPEGIRATDDFFAPRNYAGYFRQQGSQIERSGYIYGFIPREKVPNKRLGLMLKFQKDENKDAETKNADARRDLSEVFKLIRMLGRKNYIVETTDSSNGTVYCLNYAKWKFRLIKQTEKLHKCNKCGKIFTYSVGGICPEMRCDGKLVDVEAGEMRNEPYYNNIFWDDKLIPMVAREHTAQLTSKTAGLYQKDFEEGKINVLSCSTTFEMGVDVGELEATFQRNVPPETSNYIQRAGRAGRRTSSAAFSVTYSRRTSHDMTFFRDPTKIIAGKIKAPVLEVNNEKIAERHLNSIIVAWFFKQHPAYFRGDTQKVVSYGSDTNMATELFRCLQDKPKELLESIHNVMPQYVCKALGVDDWKFIEGIAGKEGSLTKAIENRAADIGGLKKFSAEVRGEVTEGSMAKKLGRAIAAERLIQTLESEPSINFLSANGVLPKYGFPIDTVSLDIISGDSEEAKKIDLTRDLKMAISEFAPPAQIVANGNVWKSYAINTIPDKMWPAYVYYECPRCKKLHPPEGHMVDATIDLKEEPPKKCSRCETMMNPRLFIIPVFGFSTQMGDKPKLVGESKPGTYYATQTQFWGIEKLTDMQKAEARERSIQFKDKAVVITYSPGGKLFVLNQGMNGRGIKVCPSCGFATDPLAVPKNGKHETKFKKVCGGRNFIHTSLGHQFSTDILKIKLPLHTVVLNVSEGAASKDQYLSILYAILEGASSALDISRDDINGCVSGDGEVVLFDDTAGGSGFVKYIYENFEKVLKAARNKVKGSCECTEETSCYGCLRNYSNQYYHDDLSRGLAYRYIDWLLDGDPNLESDKSGIPPFIQNSGNMQEEEIGIIPSNFVALDTSTRPDTVTVIEELKDATDDENLKEVYCKLIEVIGDSKTENPVLMEKIDVGISIWPEIFWGNAHVALFLPGEESQYNMLKKYDWYCYMLNNDINVGRVLDHIRI